MYSTNTFFYKVLKLITLGRSQIQVVNKVLLDLHISMEAVNVEIIESQVQHDKV